jgi:hypothetical protein
MPKVKDKNPDKREVDTDASKTIIKNKKSQKKKNFEAGKTLVDKAEGKATGGSEYLKDYASAPDVGMFKPGLLSESKTYKLDNSEENTVGLDDNNNNEQAFDVSIESKRGYLTNNFEFNSGSLADPVVEQIYNFITLSEAVGVTDDTIPKLSIYNFRRPQETVVEFIKRLYPDYPKTWDKDEDGPIILWLIKHFRDGDINWIDNCLFNRVVLGELNPEAKIGLINFIRRNQFPDGLYIPTGPETKKILISKIPPEEYKASVNDAVHS